MLPTKSKQGSASSSKHRWASTTAEHLGDGEEAARKERAWFLKWSSQVCGSLRSKTASTVSSDPQLVSCDFGRRKPKLSQNTNLFSAMVQWHCARAGPQLVRAALIFVRERTPPPGEEAPPPERLQLWQEECFASLRRTLSEKQQAAAPPRDDGGAAGGRAEGQEPSADDDANESESEQAE